MVNFSTTKMTSKGQVVIPEETRKRLNMKPGTQFMVWESNQDTLIFKVIQPPTMDDLEDLLAETRQQAKIASMKPSDITKAIKDVRAQKKQKN